MEEWERLVDGYPKNPDVKLFIKVLKTAEVALKEDLAPFELDWVTSTLFFKPVSLFDTISAKRNDAAWSKPISDAFKLIGEIVDKCQPEHLFENIVTLCLLSYTPNIRKDALSCLARVARQSAEGARDAQRLITELQDSSTSKTQLAVLVGVIAEFHPELVTESATRIWRIYLNLLESNKNTDTVINSVLQGLLGLFKHFGVDLPIMEFRDLYERISKEYIFKSKCEEVCLSILEHHADLFKELLAKDPRLRLQLWASQASAALRAVYAAIATAVSREQMMKILSSEVYPRVQSVQIRTKYIALRVLKYCSVTSGTSSDVVAGTSSDVTAGTSDSAASECDCCALAYEVKRGGVSIDKADAIHWCLESSAPGSDKLLQTCLLFHHNIPSSKRRDISVHGLLNAHEDVRTTAVSLLINESTSSPIEESIDKFLPLWKEIFDSKNGTDSIVLMKSKLVFEDIMEYLFVVMEAVIEEDLEVI
ncbi:uncharacterized protein LOC114354991 [Ostrinia furnacalis]|uniref:uncharacterized protein LOC114354991 n=1 Tax=Ostrinia furnacalis TaxID=93504 RepID=UPI00103BE03D|nr:uncharacterized protein LOC114354991 [Ostrinia furnacalis]